MTDTWREKRVAHTVLEDQMCSYTGVPGEESPDVLDAMVYALTDLMITPKQKGGLLTEQELEDEKKEEEASGQEAYALFQ